MDDKKELVGTGQLIEKQVESINDTIFGTFYNTGKGKSSKQVPDSRIIQGLANKYKIKTKEVFSEQTNDHAKVVVSAISPNGVYQEDIVIHNFTAILQEKTVLLAEKELNSKREFESMPMNRDKEFKPVFFNNIDNPFELQSNGTIIPNLTLKGQIKLFKDMTRFKTFAARDAYTKAANRAQRRVLNQEFRDEVEIELEEEEMQKISGNKINKEPIQYKIEKHDSDKSSKNKNNLETIDNVNETREDRIAVNLLTSIITRLKDSKEKLEINKENIINEAEKLAKKDPNSINEDTLKGLNDEIKKRNIK